MMGASSDADKDNLKKTITAVTQRKLLIVADKDPRVWPMCYEYGKLGHLRAQCNNEQGRPLLKKWREAGIEVALYLDDGLIWASSAQLCEESVRIVREDLKLAGVTMANAVGPGPKHFVVGTRV
ncbi:hypothetical protein COOONC_26206 [Cooperia oncophora]